MLVVTTNHHHHDFEFIVMASPYPIDGSGIYPIAAQTGESSQGTLIPTQPQTRRADELARKDRTLAEFMLMLDEYEPLVSLKSTTTFLFHLHNQYFS